MAAPNFETQRAPDGFVGGLDSALGQELFHITAAQREPEIEQVAYRMISAGKWWRA